MCIWNLETDRYIYLYFLFTGCPRSNSAKRIGYNFTRVLIWPHVDKVKMCFRNIHFFWKIFDFWKIVNIEYKDGKMGINFQLSIMVYWIEHWTDILEVPGSNPSAALLKLNSFTKIFSFFQVFQKSKICQKKCMFLKRILTLSTWGQKSTLVKL